MSPLLGKKFMLNYIYTRTLVSGYLIQVKTPLLKRPSSLEKFDFEDFHKNFQINV